MEKDIKTNKKKESGILDETNIGTKTAGVASLVVFGKFVALFFAGISFIIVARLLGPSVYGVYTLALSFAGFFAIADLGVATAANKFVGQYLNKKEDLERVISNGYLSVFLSGLFFSLIAFSISPIIAVNIIHNASQTYVIQVASFAILGAMLFTLSYNIIVGLGKGLYVALIIILQSLVQAILSITFAVYGLGALAPILGMIIAYAVSIITTLLLLVFKFNINFRIPSFGYIKRLLGFSSPISVYSGLRGVILNLAPLILALFATIVVVGNFGVAMKTSNIISNITDALGTAVLPMFAYSYATKGMRAQVGKYFNHAAYLTYILITPALLYLAILSKQFSYTVFSAQYLLAPSYITVISIGTFLWVLAIYSLMLLVSANRVKEIMKYGIVIACIELALLFTLVPLFGGIGLVFILYIISPMLFVIFFSGVAHKSLDISLDVKRLSKVIISGLISAAFILPVILVLRSHYIPILVISAAEQLILYPIIVAYIGAASREDLDLLKKAVKEIPVVNIVIRYFADYAEHFVRAGAKTSKKV